MNPPKIENYPKTININDSTYEVRIVSKIPGEPSDTAGLCDTDKKIIWIQKDQSKRGLLRTAIHEILHAFEEEHSIKLKHSTVYQLEVAIETFLNDNF